jgi:hypothetical protein
MRSECRFPLGRVLGAFPTAAVGLDVCSGALFNGLDG